MTSPTSTIDWQSVETMPKDGTPILVWLKNPIFKNNIYPAIFEKGKYSLIGQLFTWDVLHADQEILAWAYPPKGPNE